MGSINLVVLYFYFLLTSYFVVRPIRETMGVTAGGREIYDVLFSATFIVMLLLQPVYGKIVSKYSRKQFIPIIYGFFTVLMILFWATFQKFGTENITLAKNLFCICQRIQLVRCLCVLEFYGRCL